jgi:hypothetical protein
MGVGFRSRIMPVIEPIWHLTFPAPWSIIAQSQKVDAMAYVPKRSASAIARLAMARHSQQAENSYLIEVML